MIAIVILFLSYPHIKQYSSDSMQDEMNSLEIKGDFLKKFTKAIIHQQSKEIQKNDNTENKETGK